ncbi:MAG TPA: [protein-PII] uridylyltransferase [Rhizomicrobium sp.]|jgi:[protein-PII] uridylyltransferase|nr:[protein-PII] uridylyltransferase [Rhizomicrobium sp.]
MRLGQADEAVGYEPATHIDLLDGIALRRELTGLARAGCDPEKRRQSALALIKPRFQEARARIFRQVEEGARQGVAAARALSDIQDVLIKVLYDFANKHVCYAQNPTESERLAIMATGGYGRGLLAPFSDVDLLFLRPFKSTAWGESVIEFVLLMLWDVGLKVGHATRSLGQCLRIARQDLSVRTALLETRFICGEAVLGAELRRRFRDELSRSTGQEFVDAKLAEREARHRKQGESRYLVEPNVKEGKGGLRDLQTLYWIGKYLYHVDAAADLADHGVFTRDEYKIFDAAEALLWNVRCQLHCLAGRAEERLSFDVQPEVARRMGFIAPNPRRAVESFMRAYFLVAKDVGDLTRIFCAGLEEQNRKRAPVSRPPPGFADSRAPTDDFRVERGRLNAQESAFQHDPVNLIRIFHVADAMGMDVHPEAMRAIRRALDFITDTLRADRTANRLFLDLLVSRRDPERALRRMNEAGVLGRFVPAFDHAVALMQFNMYHHYTVDEHLIRAVGILASIERGEMRHDHPLASELVSHIKTREALYCAVFLHDVAKGLPGSHSETGASVAGVLCPRWGLSQSDTATAVWLVRNHLLMSDTAQRRDISDPLTVRRFVAEVQSPELLRMLLVLTIADISAVGPGVWNGWKAQLLHELYREAESWMSGGSAAGARCAGVEAKEELYRRLADWPAAARADALAHHSDSYWLAFDSGQLERNARLIGVVKNKGEPFALEMEVDPSRSATEIAVCTADHPGLFSQLAGAITACGGSIVEAKAFTADDGLALDVFAVQDREGDPFGNGSGAARLGSLIARALGGEQLPRAAFARRAGVHRAAVFDVRPRVSFDNEASATATIIEIEGADWPGLLADIACALFEESLSISTAIAATYGERAVDVFYVDDRSGHKLTEVERVNRIEERLLKALAGAP